MRVQSIDILRALTMVFMIWVNDFWTLSDIPKWLQHANATEDYLGFSDIIFPLFLFIVGLSIPYAIDNRLKKGDSKSAILKHILLRTFSLLLIGVFMVNYETAHHESILIGKHFWALLMALAVFLIWMQWSRSPVPKKWYTFLHTLGFLILIFLAYSYKGGTNGELWMKTQWWGILGLIGWAYLVNAIVYVVAKKRNPLISSISLWFVFNILSVLSTQNYFSFNNDVVNFFSVLFSGTIPAFTSTGVVAAILLRRLIHKNRNQCYSYLLLFGILNITGGFLTRPIWGISKIQGTPSWLWICSGIGLILLVLLHYIADVKKNVNWAKIIAPAGTATLTCYLLPYFIYPLRNITGFELPAFLNHSIVGLIVSFVFAILIVVLTGWLEKKRFTLKL